MLRASTTSFDRLDFQLLAPGERLVEIEVKAKIQPLSEGWRALRHDVAPADLFVLDELALRKIVDAGRYAFLLVRDIPRARWAFGRRAICSWPAASATPDASTRDPDRCSRESCSSIFPKPASNRCRCPTPSPRCVRPSDNSKRCGVTWLRGRRPGAGREVNAPDSRRSACRRRARCCASLRCSQEIAVDEAIVQAAERSGHGDVVIEELEGVASLAESWNGSYDELAELLDQVASSEAA